MPVNGILIFRIIHQRMLPEHQAIDDKYETPDSAYIPAEAWGRMAKQGRAGSVSWANELRGAAMPFKAEIYRVFIASPSDLAEERRVATEAINEWTSQHAAAESVVLLP